MHKPKIRKRRKKLGRSFFAQPTLKVAKNLLGKYLVYKKGGLLLSGKIVETEAYVGLLDPASHAYGGPSPRSEIMFGKPGYAYIYFVYGKNYCLNFVTEREGFPAAVLIRALEPREGIEAMKRNRGNVNFQNLTDGPGKLCQAFGIDKKLNGINLGGNILFVEEREKVNKKIESSERIGINSGKEKKWRFYITESQFISKR